jgi:hypothetical protein
MCLSGVGGISEECEETERMILNLLEKWTLFMPEISYVYILISNTQINTKGAPTEGRYWTSADCRAADSSSDTVPLDGDCQSQEEDRDQCPGYSA